MRSNKSNGTKKQTASTRSRGDSMNQLTLFGRLVAARGCGRPHRASTSRPSGSPRTARATPSSTTWSSGASSQTSPRPTSARDASSTSRVGFRAASGKPLTAPLDGPSRSSPTGFRRSPPRAPRRLRRRDRRGSSPRECHHSAPSRMASQIYNDLLGSALQGCTEPLGVKALRAAASLRYSRGTPPRSLDPLLPLRVLPRP